MQQLGLGPARVGAMPSTGALKGRPLAFERNWTQQMKSKENLNSVAVAAQIPSGLTSSAVVRGVLVRAVRADLVVVEELQRTCRGAVLLEPLLRTLLARS